MTNATSVSNAAHETEELFAKLEILVNNAGLMTADSTMFESDLKICLKARDVNYHGTCLIAGATLSMHVQNLGGLQNISCLNSVAAHK